MNKTEIRSKKEFLEYVNMDEETVRAILEEIQSYGKNNHAKKTATNSGIAKADLLKEYGLWRFGDRFRMEAGLLDEHTLDKIMATVAAHIDILTQSKELFLAEIKSDSNKMLADDLEAKTKYIANYQRVNATVSTLRETVKEMENSLAVLKKQELDSSEAYTELEAKKQKLEGQLGERQQEYDSLEKNIPLRFRNLTALKECHEALQEKSKKALDVLEIFTQLQAKFTRLREILEQIPHKRVNDFWNEGCNIFLR